MSERRAVTKTHRDPVCAGMSTKQNFAVTRFQACLGQVNPHLCRLVRRIKFLPDG